MTMIIGVIENWLIVILDKPWEMRFSLCSINEGKSGVYIMQNNMIGEGGGWMAGGGKN